MGVATAVAEMVVVVTVEGAMVAGALVVADGMVDVATAVVGTTVVVTGSDGLVGAVVGRPRKGPVIS